MDKESLPTILIIDWKFKLFIKPKCQTFSGSSFSNVWIFCFHLIPMGSGLIGWINQAIWGHHLELWELMMDNFPIFWYFINQQWIDSLKKKITKKEKQSKLVKSIKLIAVVLLWNTDWVGSAASESSSISNRGSGPVLLHFIWILKQGDFQVSAPENRALQTHIKPRHIVLNPTFHALLSPLQCSLLTCTGRGGRACKFTSWAWEGTHGHEQGREMGTGERSRQRGGGVRKIKRDWLEARGEREGSMGHGRCF